MLRALKKQTRKRPVHPQGDTHLSCGCGCGGVDGAGGCAVFLILTGRDGWVPE